MLSWQILYCSECWRSRSLPLCCSFWPVSCFQRGFDRDWEPLWRLSTTLHLLRSGALGLCTCSQARLTIQGVLDWCWWWQEFYEFAQGWDRQEGRTPLEMVYAIEGDMVGNQSIKLMFSNTNKWTGALKCMLANLKWALAWMIAAQNNQVLVKQKGAVMAASPMRSSAWEASRKEAGSSRKASTQLLQPSRISASEDFMAETSLVLLGDRRAAVKGM